MISRRQKIYYSLIACFLAIFLLAPYQLARAADKLPMGSFCTDNGACASGDCENSTILDSNDSKIAFCDCSWFGAGCDEYGPPTDGGTWDCTDGGSTSYTTYNLDYCESTGKKDIRSVELMKEVEKNLPAGAKKPANSVLGQASDAILDNGAFRVGLKNEITTFKPTFNIRIPGLNLTDAANTIDAQGNLQLPWLAELITALYRLGIAVASIVAVVMLIIEGARVIISAGGEEKVAAYKRIGQICVGLFLVWGSYSILYIINPDLVNFRILQVRYIAPVTIDDVVGRGTDNSEDADTTVSAPATGTCVDQNSLVNISKIVTVYGGAAKQPYVVKELADALGNAEKIAESKGKKLAITSAFRSLAEQQKLWDAALKKYNNDPAVTKKYVAPPTCKGAHLNGRAIDVFFNDGRLEPYFNGAKAKTTGTQVPDIGILQDIMKQAGFKRYCAEWWHFEFNFPRDPSTQCSP